MPLVHILAKKRKKSFLSRSRRLGGKAPPDRHGPFGPCLCLCACRLRVSFAKSFVHSPQHFGCGAEKREGIRRRKTSLFLYPFSPRCLSAVLYFPAPAPAASSRGRAFSVRTGREKRSAKSRFFMKKAHLQAFFDESIETNSVKFSFV